MKYRKKPVVIEAKQWFKHGDHPKDDFFRPTGVIPKEEREGNIVRCFRRPYFIESHQCNHCGNKMRWHGWIETLEGGHIVCPGDYIITGIKGEHYPYKPDIFEATYEKVEE
jgi:ribosomal protein L37E